LAVTSSVVSRWLVERRAAAVARYWIDAVRAGRLAVQRQGGPVERWLVAGFTLER
jgi:hypothetical protein